MIYLAWERKYILAHVAIGMNPEGNMLSEIHVSQKENTVWFHLYEVPKLAKFAGTKSKWWFPGTGGKGECKVFV